MSVTDVRKDLEALTMTVAAEYDVPAERAWQLWADPRQLERWWGPPAYPATVVDHDLSVGGQVAYFMTGPEGDRHHGWWQVLESRPPRVLVIDDGFADADGTRLADPPVCRMRVDIVDRPGGVTCTVTTTFPSLEALQTLVGMGMEEGLRLAMGQIDEILAGYAVA